MFEFDACEAEPMATFRLLYDQETRLLAEIAAGKTKRRFLPPEIAFHEHERDRLASLMSAWQAAMAAEACEIQED